VTKSPEDHSEPGRIWKDLRNETEFSLQLVLPHSVKLSAPPDEEQQPDRRKRKHPQSQSPEQSPKRRRKAGQMEEKIPESTALSSEASSSGSTFVEPPLVIQLPHETLKTAPTALQSADDANSELFSQHESGGGGDLVSTSAAVVTWGGVTGDQGLPRIMKFPATVDQMAFGEAHACAWKTATKGLYTWGLNDSLQLGISSASETDQSGAFAVDRFSNDVIRHAACGLSHTAVVLNSGALICFGSNEFGQCGIEDQSELSLPPTDLSELRYERFVKVVCGDNFTFALTKTGKVFGFGNNDQGQLALENETSYFKPTIVRSLFGVPVVNITCGESHTLALTAIGSVFSWGRNKYGELGLGHTRPEKKPQLISSLNSIRITQISCGSFHSGVVSAKGKLFMFGKNTFGQCGTGSSGENVLRPTKVSLFQNNTVESVSCGREHTVCLVGGDVYAFGANDMGQCMYAGDDTSSIATPKLLSLVNKQTDKVLKVFAGSFSCFAVVRRIDDEFDLDNASVETQADDDRINYNGDGNMEEKGDEKALGLQKGFSSVSALPKNELYHMTPQGIQSRCAVARASEEYGSLIHIVTKSLSTCACVNASFLSTRDEDMITFLSSGVDLQSVRPTFERLLALSVPELANRMSKAMLGMLDDAKTQLDAIEHPDSLRFILIMYEIPQWQDSGFSKTFLLTLNRILIGLRTNLKRQVQRWFSLYDESLFLRLVRGLQERISAIIEGSSKVDGFVISIILVLEVLHEANVEREKPISYKEFQSIAISRSQEIDLNQHYISWVQEKYGRGGGNNFSMCKYPFILDTFAKQEILRYEAVLQMQHEAQKAIQASFWFMPANPYFILQVRRSHLLHDALVQVNEVIRTNASVLKRPLKVAFHGEEGVDEGGVKKEFFQLIVREIFKEEFGMFTYNHERRTFWFNQNSLETGAEFQMIGVILGLGIYNLTNLDVHFPQVVYKKLCKETPSTADLREFDPVVAKSMAELLEFKGDVENVFCLSFSASVDFFGSTKIVEFKKDGHNIPVTEANRKEYVELYTKYLLVDSVEKQFTPFAKGFHAVIDGPALSLLRPQELEVLICGNTFLDFQALEAKTQYRGGFHAESRVIKWFWSVVHDMDLESKKKLLKFATGTDRAPLRGLGHLPFIIQNAGANTDQLPTSHTCFNTLLIPNYSSFEEVKRKLYIAIENSEGFGLQ
jgi:E3 ubiquitin-protein ligase HERC4